MPPHLPHPREHGVEECRKDWHALALCEWRQPQQVQLTHPSWLRQCPICCRGFKQDLKPHSTEVQQRLWNALADWDEEQKLAGARKVKGEALLVKRGVGKSKEKKSLHADKPLSPPPTPAKRGAAAPPSSRARAGRSSVARRQVSNWVWYLAVLGASWGHELLTLPISHSPKQEHFGSSDVEVMEVRRPPGSLAPHFHSVHPLPWKQGPINNVRSHEPVDSDVEVVAVCALCFFSPVSHPDPKSFKGPSPARNTTAGTFGNPIAVLSEDEEDDAYTPRVGGKRKRGLSVTHRRLSRKGGDGRVIALI